MDNELPKQSHALRNILIVVLVVIFSVVIYIERDWIHGLGSLGYIGVFLAGLVASAAMFAPMPGLLVLAAAASALDPFLAAMIFAVGAAIGELSGYMVGFSGRGVVERSKWYDQMERWMKKYGGITIMVIGFIPMLFIDVGGMVAGALKMPWYTFLFWCLLGKIPKCLLVAYGGAALFKFF